MSYAAEGIKAYDKSSNSNSAEKKQPPSPIEMHRKLAKLFREELKIGGVVEGGLRDVNSAKNEFDKTGNSSALEKLYKKHFGPANNGEKGKNIDIKI